MAESVSDGTGPPRDNLTWCRAVIYTHVAILGLSVVARWLDCPKIGLPFEIRSALIGVLVPPMVYGLYFSPLVMVIVLWRLKHSSSAYCVVLSFLDAALSFVQAGIMLPLVQES